MFKFISGERVSVNMIVRSVANIIVVVGLVLLIRILYNAFAGSLAGEIFPQSQGSWIMNGYALGLILPVPFHVISIGLILKKKWLSPFWARTAWFAIVISGCWLGTALGIKLMIL